MHALLTTTALATAFAGAAAATKPTETPAAPTKGKTGPKAGAERIAPQITGVDTDVPMPATSRAGSKSAYPFDQLTAVGMSFHVANKTAKQMSSIVSNQNRKGEVDKTDAAGNVIRKQGEPIKDANGAVVGHAQGEPERVRTVEYFAQDVGDTDPRGKGVRVYRKA